MIPPFPEAQTIPSPWHRLANIASASYRRFPLGFIPAASSTIPTRLAGLRCAPAAINWQIRAKTLEVEALSRQQRVTLEVREHALEHVLEPACFPLESLVAPVRPDASAPKLGLNELKDFGPIPVLADREAGPHLPPDRKLRSRGDGNGEAAFSVDVAGDVGREELATVSGAGV